MEAERIAREKEEEARKKAEELAEKEREDFINNIISQQIGGINYEVERFGQYIWITIIDNDPNLINSVTADIEDVRYTQIKQNIAAWTGELKEKYTNRFKEEVSVKYTYNAGEKWFGTAENGKIIADYLY